MNGIPIYAADESDFGTNGLGLLYPLSCEVHGNSSAMYELTIEMPVTRDGKFLLLQPERIIKAACPVPDAPVIHQGGGGGESTGTGEIWRIKKNLHVNLRSKPSSASGSKIIGTYPGLTEMLVLEKTTASWYHVQILNGGATGYMFATYLEYVRDESGGGGGGGGGDVRPEISRMQLFRIYSVEPDTDQQTCIARAMHIFYDLRGNLINGEYTPDNANAVTTLQTCFTRLTDAHDFTLYVGDISGNVSGEYGYRSFVDVLLNPEDGILAQVNARLLRDNYNIYVIPNDEVDRGMQIRRGKNLRSLAVTYDTSEVITRIIPVGEDANGDPLYITGKYVDSIYINDYPFIRAKKIEYDIKVDKNGDYPTVAAARQALTDAAQREFDDAHVDIAAYGMQVDFIMLETSSEYAKFAQLQKVFLHDLVTVTDDLIGVHAKLRVNDYYWDSTLERYNSLVIGTLLDNEGGNYSGGLSLGGVSAVGGGSSSVARELLDLDSGDNDSVMYQALAHALDLARASISGGASAEDVLATAILALKNVIGS